MLVRLVHCPAFHAPAALLFLVSMLVGYRYAGGLGFVQGGSDAAQSPKEATA